MKDDAKIEEVEKRMYSAFSQVAESIGYSPIHGQIIGVLLVGGGSMTLQDIAKKTGYSTSMISLSLDLLELLGVIKKIKKTADRKLYIELNSNLIEALKNILMIRISKALSGSLAQFEKDRRDIACLSGSNKKEVMRAIEILEKEIKRLDGYFRILSKVSLP
jgi:DNA-binding transcriptional regulator GbsR (MarR family)